MSIAFLTEPAPPFSNEQGTSPGCTLFIALVARLLLVVAAGGVPLFADGETPWTPPRCEAIPQPEEQVSFRVEGVEKLRWHFSPRYERPFFFPLTGPESGEPLTRVGHPGAPDHDHHRSVWFAHNKVGDGQNFWANNSPCRIRQKDWLVYEDGAEHCRMAARLGWMGAEGREIMEQELIATLSPLAGGEYLLELQSTFTPAEEEILIGQSNFGFLAVRVAKSLSVHFGGGKLTDSEGREGEKAIFDQRARWVDYSGPVAAVRGGERLVLTEGITYIDHPGNPHYPSHWHVRSDGWMGASFCHAQDFTIKKEEPLTLRYALYVHSGAADAKKIEEAAVRFEKRSRTLKVVKSTRTHFQYEIVGAAEE